MGKHNTPMLDELEKGPWPSFVSDIKQQAEKGKQVLKEAPDDLLGILELSYEDRVTHWKHGGIVGVFGYGGGDHRKVLRPASKFPRCGPFPHYPRKSALEQVLHHGIPCANCATFGRNTAAV